MTAGIAEVVITTELFRPSLRQQTVKRKRLHDVQAFSRIGLVNAAWAIAQAQQRAALAVLAGPEHGS